LLTALALCFLSFSADGHVTNAARSLGLERSHLYKKCKQLGIDMRDET